MFAFSLPNTFGTNAYDTIDGDYINLAHKLIGGAEEDPKKSDYIARLKRLVRIISEFEKSRRKKNQNAKASFIMYKLQRLKVDHPDYCNKKFKNLKTVDEYIKEYKKILKKKGILNEVDINLSTVSSVMSRYEDNSDYYNSDYENFDLDSTDYQLINNNYTVENEKEKEKDKEPTQDEIAAVHQARVEQNRVKELTEEEKEKKRKLQELGDNAYKKMVDYYNGYLSKDFENKVKQDLHGVTNQKDIIEYFEKLTDEYVNKAQTIFGELKRRKKEGYSYSKEKTQDLNQARFDSLENIDRIGKEFGLNIAKLDNERLTGKIQIEPIAHLDLTDDKDEPHTGKAEPPAQKKTSKDKAIEKGEEAVDDFEDRVEKLNLLNDGVHQKLDKALQEIQTGAREKKESSLDDEVVQINRLRKNYDDLYKEYNDKIKPAATYDIARTVNFDMIFNNADKGLSRYTSSVHNLFPDLQFEPSSMAQLERDRHDQELLDRLAKLNDERIVLIQALNALKTKNVNEDFKTDFAGLLNKKEELNRERTLLITEANIQKSDHKPDDAIVRDTERRLSDIDARGVKILELINSINKKVAAYDRAIGKTRSAEENLNNCLTALDNVLAKFTNVEEQVKALDGYDKSGPTYKQKLEEAALAYNDACAQNTLATNALKNKKLKISEDAFIKAQETVANIEKKKAELSLTILGEKVQRENNALKNVSDPNAAPPEPKRAKTTADIFSKKSKKKKNADDAWLDEIEIDPGPTEEAKEAVVQKEAQPEHMKEQQAAVNKNDQIAGLMPAEQVKAAPQPIGKAPLQEETIGSTLQKALGSMATGSLWSAWGNMKPFNSAPRAALPTLQDVNRMEQRASAAPPYRLAPTYPGYTKVGDTVKRSHPGRPTNLELTGVPSAAHARKLKKQGIDPTELAEMYGPSGYNKQAQLGSAAKRTSDPIGIRDGYHDIEFVSDPYQIITSHRANPVTAADAILESAHKMAQNYWKDEDIPARDKTGEEITADEGKARKLEKAAAAIEQEKKDDQRLEKLREEIKQLRSAQTKAQVSSSLGNAVKGALTLTRVVADNYRPLQHKLLDYKIDSQIYGPLYNGINKVTSWFSGKGLHKCKKVKKHRRRRKYKILGGRIIPPKSLRKMF